MRRPSREKFVQGVATVIVMSFMPDFIPLGRLMTRDALIPFGFQKASIVQQGKENKAADELIVQNSSSSICWGQFKGGGGLRTPMY